MTFEAIAVAHAKDGKKLQAVLDGFRADFNVPRDS